MKLLVIGGTLFLGRHLVDAALAAGHQVTLFNRGRTNPDLYPGVETLRGDRTTDLQLLDGRRWDAAVDTCGYLPGPARASAERLRHAVGHYTFISSISVYEGSPPAGAGESTPLQTHPEGAPVEEFRAEHYGSLKVLCEEAVEQALGARALIVRSGLLAGPCDPTGRLPYWIQRVAEGGEVLAPGSPARPLQLIHARDMAGWILRMAEDGRGGTFNVTGPDYPLTMGALLDTIGAVTGAEARVTWAPERFLLDQGVAPWTELPLWLPEEWGGMLNVGIERAIGAGLAFRPLEETIRETHDWMRAGWSLGTLASGMPLGAGLTREREAALLAALPRP